MLHGPKVPRDPSPLRFDFVAVFFVLLFAACFGVVLRSSVLDAPDSVNHVGDLELLCFGVASRIDVGSSCVYAARLCVLLQVLRHTSNIASLFFVQWECIVFPVTRWILVS